jgi:hypothetical protein
MRGDFRHAADRPSSPHGGSSASFFTERAEGLLGSEELSQPTPSLQTEILSGHEKIATLHRQGLHIGIKSAKLAGVAGDGLIEPRPRVRAFLVWYVGDASFEAV